MAFLRAEVSLTSRRRPPSHRNGLFALVCSRSLFLALSLRSVALSCYLLLLQCVPKRTDTG